MVNSILHSQVFLLWFMVSVIALVCYKVDFVLAFWFITLQTILTKQPVQCDTVDNGVVVQLQLLLELE
jgi:hypothetical protein